MLKVFFILMGFMPITFAATQSIAPEVKTGVERKDLVIGKRSMVVTNNPWASKAANQILSEGGNAVDAAIAAGFVLGLTEPQSSGIGGGGYALTYNKKNNKMVVYDGREVAPKSANPNWFLKEDGTPLDFDIAYKTALAIGVPGEVAMFYKMHQEAGKLPWEKLLEPAIELATNGFPMSKRLFGLLESEKKSLPNIAEVKTLFYTDDNEVKPVGTKIINLAYANSLKLIAKNPNDFYTGEIANDIVMAINKKAGKPLYSNEDLKNYSVKKYPAICSLYRNSYNICSIPPSSSGGVTVEELMLIYANVSSIKDVNDANWVYYFLESSKLAFADRNQYLADPDFVIQPVKGLLDKKYIKSRSDLISDKALNTPVKAGTPDGIDKTYAPDSSSKKPGTTSMAIVDKYGNAISMTVTIENQFGSHTYVDGFLLNNELTDFSFVPQLNGQPVANRVEALKRPRSSIAPVLVFSKQNQLVAVAGSPGGSQIICYVAKSLIRMLDFKQTPLEAGSAGNLCATNSIPVFESGTSLTSIIPKMEDKGEKIVQRDLVSGEVNIISTKSGWSGAADPRREGVAIGN